MIAGKLIQHGAGVPFNHVPFPFLKDDLHSCFVKEVLKDGFIRISDVDPYVCDCIGHETIGRSSTCVTILTVVRSMARHHTSELI